MQPGCSVSLPDIPLRSRRCNVPSIFSNQDDQQKGKLGIKPSVINQEAMEDDSETPVLLPA